MKRLTAPMTMWDYVLDPATDNPKFQTRKMPKGIINESEKRQWLAEESVNLKCAAHDAELQYQKTGQYFFKSLSDALLQEAKECRLASTRKYIERTPC